MNCPVCNVTLAMSTREGVEIDYCPKCRGVWLDRGEIDKIIEKAMQTLPLQQTARFNDDDEERQESRQPPPAQQYQTQQPPKKRGGFLGEIFDWD